MNDTTPTTVSDRVVAIDALRGFDMFWIMGGKPLLLAIVAAILQSKGSLHCKAINQGQLRQPPSAPQVQPRGIGTLADSVEAGKN